MATTIPQSLVLVTGAAGFIAKHTIQQLLEAGYRVRGTVLNDEEARIAMEAQPSSDQFSVVVADLTDDKGWDEAVEGCDYVIHLASPYPLDPPKGGRDALVPIAREGTIRVVKRALGVVSIKRIIVVSSVTAMQYWEDRPRPIVNITEDSWTDPEWKAVPAYPLSKTLAERALWDLVEMSKDPKDAKERVVVVNPAMVWGPMYDKNLSASSEICKLILSGNFPAMPGVAYPIVDVRDVAKLFVATLATEEKVGGRRLVACGNTLSFQELVRTLAKRFPKYANKIPTRIMPSWLLWLLSFFDKSLQLPLLDAYTSSIYDTQYVTELTGVTFRPATEAVCAMAESLIDNDLV